MAIRRIGQILVDMGFINDDQLEMLLEEQDRQPGKKLGEVAEDVGLVTDEQVAQALAEQMNMQVISLEDFELDDETRDQISETMAQMYNVIPIRRDDDSLTIATCEPQNLVIQDDLRTFLGLDIKTLVATQREITAALEKYYNAGGESVERIVEELENDESLKKLAEEMETSTAFDLTSAEALADSAPVRKLLNMILLLAIKDHASDIHFEPFEEEFRIRIKADGVLYEMVPPPRHLAFAITTRIKVMADLDIAERRMPQDGRIELVVGGHSVDLRVSVLPTMFGESTVMRVLDRSVVSLDLNKVGMDAPTMKQFREVIEKPNGIVLVTGPTGSGKTTTLYSALSELNVIEEKLITTEDPVEYDIDGIIQIPVDSDIDVTFAACLRSILRQDPDRILVGEIRDLETAEIAIQASLTGHMVFSTLHTNDAPSSVTRLKDMGIPTFLITATVEAILAQRLVRRICTQCQAEIEPTDDILAELDLTLETLGERKLYRGSGCEGCNSTGYKGRVGLFELMIMNDELRELIINNAPIDTLRDAARGYGMVSLRDAGEAFMFDGVTTPDEVIRETIMEA